MEVKKKVRKRIETIKSKAAKYLRKYSKESRFFDEGAVDPERAYPMIFNKIPGRYYLVAPEHVINKIAMVLAGEADIDTLSEKVTIDRFKSIVTTKLLVSYEKGFLFETSIKDHSLVSEETKIKFPNVYNSTNPVVSIERELRGQYGTETQEEYIEDDDDDFEDGSKQFSMEDFRSGLHSKTEDNSKINSIAIYYEIGSKFTLSIMQKIHELVKGYDATPIKTKTGGIYILAQTSSGGINKIFYPHKTMDIRVPVLYPEELAEGYNVLKEEVSKMGHKGLILLTGKPGTGKTTLIKQLSKEIPDKDFIFISSANATVLSEPSFMTFLLSNPNSVLVIEESQTILMDRKTNPHGTGAVANLLNLTDGILSDALNIICICTMNSERTVIDEALLREGRLLAEMYFNYLPVEQANNICKEYSIDKTYTAADKEITLAKIFSKKTYRILESKDKKIGFGTQV